MQFQTELTVAILSLSEGVVVVLGAGVGVGLERSRAGESCADRGESEVTRIVGILHRNDTGPFG